MTLPVTIQLTEDEAFALADALEHLSQDMEDRLPDVEVMTEDERELADSWRSMFNIAQRVNALIEATIAENFITTTND